MAYVSNFLTQSSTTGGATVVLTLPPHVTNDIIVVCVSADGGGTLSVTWGGDSTATGQVGTTQVSGLLLSGAVFYARATGVAATATVNMGTLDAIHVHMVILKDVDTTTHLDASNATVGTTATEFTTASITTTTADCLILYYVAGDDATTTPHAIHSRPGPTATMHFLDSSDNGGTTVTTLASGALGWYIQRAATGTPQPQWDQSSTEVYASFVMAWRNVSGGIIPAYADDSASLGRQLMTGSWWASATTRNNQNFKATPLSIAACGKQLLITATSGNGTTAVLTFADQGTAPFVVGERIVVAGGITPTGYASATVAVSACTSTTVSYLNATTGAMTVPGTVSNLVATFDAGAAVVDAGLNPYSSAVNSTPASSTVAAVGIELIFPTTEYDWTTGWVVGAFQASTSKMALFNQGSIAQGGGHLVVGKVFNGIATTAATSSAGTATITFAAQTIAIPTGSLVTVAGVTPTGFNGTYVVTGGSTTTVTYANSTAGPQTVAGTVTANQWRTYKVMARDNQDGAGAGFATFSVQPSQSTTAVGKSYGDVVPITKIDRLWVLNKGQNATAAFYYCDFHFIKMLIVAGGTSAVPVDTQGFFDAGKFCRIPLLKKSGASGLVAYVPVQIGGDDAVNFQIDAGALQFPRIYSTTAKEVNYHGASNAIGISYAGKSGDTIKHTNSVVTSPSPYYWEINSAATSAATWDFNGLVIVGANVTLRNVMTFSSMAFSSCPTLNFTGCTVTGATISRVPAGNDTLTTNGSTVISGSTINVTGVTAGNRWASVASPVIFASNAFTGSHTTGHATRITSTTGSPFALVGNTFTSFGPTVFGFHTTNDVDASAETVTKASHGYTDGDPIQYMKQGGSAAIGLTDTAIYYVRAVSSSLLSFYDTAAHAIAGGATGRSDLSQAGTETHYINSLGAAIFNDSSGAITVNISGGGTTPTIRNGAGASTTVQNLVTVKVTVKDANTLAVIASARVLLEAAAGGSLPAGASVTIASSGTTATVTHASHGMSTGMSVIIRGANESEYLGIWTITVIDTGSYFYTMLTDPAGSAATGTITATCAILSDVTDGSGVLQTTTFNYTSNQPVTGKVRRSTTALGTKYKTGAITGTITSTGLDTTALLISDE